MTHASQIIYHEVLTYDSSTNVKLIHCLMKIDYYLHVRSNHMHEKIFRSTAKSLIIVSVGKYIQHFISILSVK